MDIDRMKGRPFVLYDGQFFNLYSAKGELIENNIFIRVHDEVDMLPTAVCKFVVTIVNSVEEMQEIIKKEQAT